MSYTVELDYNGNKHTKLLVVTKEDNCPICDEPLRDALFTYNMFHGEVSSSCCGAPYQTKDFYVDDDKRPAYAQYFEEVNKPGVMSLSIADEWVEPLRRALKDSGESSIRNERVRELAKQYHDEAGILQKGESNET